MAAAITRLAIHVPAGRVATDRVGLTHDVGGNGQVCCVDLARRR